MKPKTYLYLPFLILLSLFLIDKIVLVPAFQKCCLKKGDKVFFQTSLNNEFLEEKRIREAFANHKKVAISFGSSLSYGFDFNQRKEYSDIINKLSAERILKLQKWEMTNIITPGATVITHYVRLHQILDRGLKPNLILIELAPHSFNAGSPYYDDEIVEAVPFLFALTHFNEIPIEHLRKIMISRIFLLSHFKIGRPTEFISIYGAGGNLKEIPESSKVGFENSSKAFVNGFILQGIKEVYKNYRIAKDLEAYYYLLLNKAKKENIPIVFWSPTLHPLANKALSEINVPPLWESFLRKSGILPYYLNFNSNENFCNEFVDPIHMGFNCFPKNFHLFVEKVENDK